MNKNAEKLKERIVEISHFASIASLLEWDQEVMMPKKAVDLRAQTSAHLAALIHKKYTDIDSDGLLSDLKKQLDKDELGRDEAIIVRETWRDFEREIKLPEKFVKELAEVTSKAQSIWAEAREKNDFSLFLPHLSHVVKLKKEEARLVGYENSPYDALLDTYEPGMKTVEAAEVLGDLKDFLIPFLKKINSSKEKWDHKIFRGNFPIEKQMRFNESVAQKIGFDFDAGRLDKSTHPFTQGIHPHDVRITTRYKKDNVFYALGSTIHEAGHGLYEQNLSAKQFGTPLAQSISMGIHESQSRLWENNVGKSREFWKYFYPKLKKEFPTPFNTVNAHDFYNTINSVQPSFIRTEADEVTYNLHIILRFEIEKDIIEGTIDLKELPRIWNSKFEDYFGLKVPSDSLGVLQDIHWSCGLFGYFPTYSLGNLYAAQFYATMNKQIPGLKNKISKGDFTEIKHWLNKNIHIHGRTYSAPALLKKVTGETLHSAYFNSYIERKYKDIYKLT